MSIKNLKRFLLVSVLVSLSAGILVAFLPETAMLYGMTSGFVIIAILAGVAFWVVEKDLLTIRLKRNVNKGFESRKIKKAYYKEQKAKVREIKKAKANEILNDEKAKIQAFINANPHLK